MLFIGEQGGTTAIKDYYTPTETHHNFHTMLEDDPVRTTIQNQLRDWITQHSYSTDITAK